MRIYGKSFCFGTGISILFIFLIVFSIQMNIIKETMKKGSDVMLTESQTVELKREFTPSLIKTIIAFANTSGGEIIIGADDDGTIVGVDNADAAMQKITNSARDAIKPDITMFMLCERQKRNDKEIISVSVQKGTACPYYLASKGIRPEGVFVRQGTSSVPASESAIIRMIKETSDNRYEIACSLNQDLTFSKAEEIFAYYKLPFGKEQKRTLGLIGHGGAYTNLGLLLSEQCPHAIKIAVFRGPQKTQFKDRREITGSVFSQLDEASAYIDQFNNTSAEIKGLYRIDTRDYPKTALREALLNAIIHRDYSFSAPTLISIFNDRIEFLSLGGIPQGITLKDILLGVSLPRNEKLANVFYRLKLIEAYGTGFLKIMESYEDCLEKPEIQVSDNAFKVTLPNKNYCKYEKASEISHINERITDYIIEHKSFSRQDLQHALGLSLSTASRHINALVGKGKIVRIGTGRATYYRMK